MPEVVTQDELDFLFEVHDLAEKGLPIIEIARELGVSPGTVNYRLNRHGMTIASAKKLVDRRSGLGLEQMMKADQLRVEGRDYSDRDAEPAEAAR